ncbi:metallophosphoesterase family protein [Falsihalocynthiibacter sp. SS001]|uniref:metallophosphoesterase family protein n=1 Tax=Falsihalocynthiibacter sp. SS001 TaxID=3349698 RepID=UPI0036D318FD
MRKLFDRLRKQVEFTAPIKVDEPCVLVGDIHGRFDLLVKLLKRIEEEPRAKLVFLGDYIDRGSQSAEVLELLHDLCRAHTALCLMGNHERMMLDFLDNPIENAHRWLKFGGMETLASFGIHPTANTPTALEAQTICRDLRVAITPKAEQWLRALPLTYSTGNLACVHAAADPRLPITEQAPATLLWGHPEFRKRARTDGIWIAHGHTVVDVPQAQDGRISIDTGAYITGVLTAARIDPSSQVRFIQVR